MADEEAQNAPEEEPAPKAGKGGLIIWGGGVAAMLAAAAGGWFATSAELLPLPPRHAEAGTEKHAPIEGPNVAFVPLTPLVVTLGDGDALRQLQLSAQLEVTPEAVETVTLLTPRVVDVLNTYLRAVDSATVEDPSAMLRMRAQMLRRVQVVTGEGMVRDLLVAELILR